MLAKIKYMGFFFSVIAIVILGVVFLGNDEKEDAKDSSEALKAIQQVSTSVGNGQYRMSFGYIGDKSQIIDLIKGKAKLNTIYSGNSNFTARILYSDGSLLTMIADVNGPFNQKQEIDVPETGNYLLDVKTSGEWSFSRE